jgi:hypothetical protein
LLSAIISQAEKMEEVKDRLLHYLLCFNICTENRNILSHSILHHADVEIAKFSKRASNNPQQEIQFEIPMSELRQVADDIGATYEFGVDLYLWLLQRKSCEPGYVFKDGEIGLPFPQQPGSLPDKPQKPRTLTPYRPLEAGKGAQPPPRPSGT